mmetsp:Transcript_10292/g.25241  ORF Transcript_10292/g.25241 Transcript_10292/m.25241 type:complete len:274 (-) Transcript_10292:73-894(-)
MPPKCPPGAPPPALYWCVGAPPMMAAMAEHAASTQCGLPATITLHGWPVWSIWRRAPVCVWMPLMVSPPRPIIRPTISLGHSTVWLACPGPTKPPPPKPPLLPWDTGPPSSRSVIILTATVTHPPGPDTAILRGSPSGKFWSMVMCAPDCAWRPLMVSPPLPMTRPTSPGGHSRVSVLGAIGSLEAGAATAAAAAGAAAEGVACAANPRVDAASEEAAGRTACRCARGARGAHPHGVAANATELVHALAASATSPRAERAVVMDITLLRCFVS